jgi:threonine/homoserine/homoserine lactone efflux protein
MPLVEFTALLVLATAMSFTPALLLVCAAGLGAVVMAVPALRWAIKAVGIGYLLWLALRLARSARLSEADAARLSVGFWEGAALQFVNIKAWLLALTIVAGWIVGREDHLQRLAIVVPVMVAFAFTSNLTYAAMGALLRHWLAHGRRLLWFNRAMAAVLVATALWMVAA